MFKKKEQESLSVIAKDTQTGSLTTNGGIVVLGTVQGDVSAKDVNVFGSITGNIISTGLVQLRQGSRVLGTITCLAVEIDEGTYFENTLIVGKSLSTKEAPTYEDSEVNSEE